MMHILIIDEEVYLAQKVAMRLHDEGHDCTHVANIKEINFDMKFDTVLLSTNLSSEDVHRIIEKFKQSTIILLVSYINDVTVTKPLEDGADDYIQKPFIMNELVRKIHHYRKFKQLKSENRNLKNYIDFAFNNVEYDFELPETLPFVIETNDQKIADKAVFDVAKKLNKTIKFISMEKHTKIEPSDYEDELLYIYDFHFLKKAAKQALLKSIKDTDVIVCSLEDVEESDYPKVYAKSTNKLSTVDSILTINDYVKMMVLSFQDKYPDTELSKRLGISRKSLWEKRKNSVSKKTRTTNR